MTLLLRFFPTVHRGGCCIKSDSPIPPPLSVLACVVKRCVWKLLSPSHWLGHRTVMMGWCYPASPWGPEAEPLRSCSGANDEVKLKRSVSAAACLERAVTLRSLQCDLLRARPPCCEATPPSQADARRPMLVFKQPVVDESTFYWHHWKSSCYINAVFCSELMYQEQVCNDGKSIKSFHWRHSFRLLYIQSNSFMGLQWLHSIHQSLIWGTAAVK